jgi:APA family basic amino acid/polyamine antiporter
MRFTHKEVPRGFRVPLGPWVIPPIGALFCVLLMVTSSKETGIRLVIWMAIGQVIYFTYGYWHSKLRFSKEIEPPLAIENLAAASDYQSPTNPYELEMDDVKNEKF